MPGDQTVSRTRRLYVTQYAVTVILLVLLARYLGAGPADATDLATIATIGFLAYLAFGVWEPD